MNYRDLAAGLRGNATILESMAKWMKAKADILDHLAKFQTEEKGVRIIPEEPPYGPYRATVAGPISWWVRTPKVNSKPQDVVDIMLAEERAFREVASSFGGKIISEERVTLKKAYVGLQIMQLVIEFDDRRTAQAAASELSRRVNHPVPIFFTKGLEK